MPPSEQHFSVVSASVPTSRFHACLNFASLPSSSWTVTYNQTHTQPFPLAFGHGSNRKCVCVCVCVCEREREREREWEWKCIHLPSVHVRIREWFGGGLFFSLLSHGPQDLVADLAASTFNYWTTDSWVFLRFLLLMIFIFLLIVWPQCFSPNSSSEQPVDILQIFRVGRVNEATEFLSKLGNVRLLFHGSPVRNILGILSR
jgi:hypothetical protein